jgi:hypothetical protein
MTTVGHCDRVDKGAHKKLVLIKNVAREPKFYYCFIFFLQSDHQSILFLCILFEFDHLS